MTTPPIKPGPKQFETYLLRLKDATLSKIPGVKAISFLPYEGIFPCRLDITPLHSKQIQEILGEIAALGLPIQTDVRPSHFFVDIDEVKFLEARSSALSMREEHNLEITHTTTVKKRFSSELSVTNIGADLFPKQEEFRALMISYNFSDLSLSPTERKSIVQVKGSLQRILQFCYEVLDPYKIQYSSSSNTALEVGKDYIYVILEEKTNYLLLVRKSESQSASAALQEIESLIDLRRLNDAEKARLLTAYVDPEIVVDVAKNLNLLGDAETMPADNSLPEGCVIVKADDFYFIENNTIKIKPFKP